ncbi:linker for activation of T-cells family member 2 isoform X1 [Strigops habroptila]|uniref:linker for activation of T-cells family member 2 isoform X1 n=1 Tax=Strigops habroptila TaxID=2489341 RepID=UPI0011CFAE07|nr:linker for activation of T-cells family member 2 isoform X1 [Strigops habroptila]
MAQLELLWAAAALMLLGAAVSLCVKCQLSATKREKQLNERRSQLRSQQSFEVIRSHSAMTRRLEQIKEPENLSIVRKTTKELGATRHAGYGSRAESRYRDFLTEDCLQGEAAYVEPISLDYYNCATFFTPPNEKEEDSHSYQNIIIGVSQGSDTGRCCCCGSRVSQSYLGVQRGMVTCLAQETLLIHRLSSSYCSQATWAAAGTEQTWRVSACCRRMCVIILRG